MNNLGLRPLHANLLAFVLMAVIFYLSHQPDTGLERMFPWLSGTLADLLHIPMYGLLALLYWFGSRHHFQHTMAATLFALTLTLLYGISDEWHQSFIPGRNPALDDIAKDLLGGISALFAANYWQNKKATAGQKA